MTNNNTITLNSDTHGTFTVKSSHLLEVSHAHHYNITDSLHLRIARLVGVEVADYTDLNRFESLILISYLTGGIAD